MKKVVTKLVKNAIGAADALMQAQEIFERCLPDARIEKSVGGTSIDVTVERAWSVSASAAVTWIMPFTIHPVKLDGGPAGKFVALDLKASITWSSSARDVVQSIAALALYRQVVDAVAEVEAALGNRSVVIPYPDYELTGVVMKVPRS